MAKGKTVVTKQKLIGGEITQEVGRFKVGITLLPYMAWLDVISFSQAMGRSFGVDVVTKVVTSIEGPGLPEELEYEAVRVAGRVRHVVPFEVLSEALSYTEQNKLFEVVNTLHRFDEEEEKNS